MHLEEALWMPTNKRSTFTFEPTLSSAGIQEAAFCPDSGRVDGGAVFMPPLPSPPHAAW
jgi:hypothetical protein